MIGKLFRHILEIARVAVTLPTALGMRRRLASAIPGSGGYIERFAVKTMLEQRWLVFLGGASYCIYFLQTPVRYILDDMVFGDEMATSYFPVLIIVSGLCFHYIGEPARQLIKQRTARP